ncbi:MAG: SGNH/GDSL hydrolase family protein, partial [Ilumatobacteraceae bacterium]
MAAEKTVVLLPYRSRIGWAIATVESDRYVKKCLRITCQPCHNEWVSTCSAFFRSPRGASILGGFLVVVAAIVPHASVQAIPRTPGIGINGQGTLLFVGDSLTVGTDAFGSLGVKLQRLGTWNETVVDARVGRTANAGSVVLQKRITRATTAIVIALGTNDMISKTRASYPKWVIDRVMSKSKGRPVLWVNLEFANKTRPDLALRAKRFNTELRRAVKRWPNLFVSDWNSAFTPNKNSRFIADGVHLTVAGYRTRSKYLVPNVFSFGSIIVNASTTTTTT